MTVRIVCPRFESDGTDCSGVWRFTTDGAAVLLAGRSCTHEVDGVTYWLAVADGRAAVQREQAPAA